MAAVNPYLLERHEILSETIRSAAPLEANRLVNRTGNYPALGGYAAGITQQKVDPIQWVAITTEGYEVVEVGGAIPAVDTPLISTANGRVTPVTNPATQYVVGYAMDTATGSGTEFIRVKLN